MSKQNKRALLVGLAAALFTCFLLPVGWWGYSLVRLAQNKGLTTVRGGTVEEIVSRSRKPDDVFVSPTGRWLLISTEDTSQWFILDTQTDQERPLDIANLYADLRWVNEEEFAVGNRIVKATDLSVRELETLSHHEHENDVAALEILRGVKQVYLLPKRGTSSGADVMSGDPTYPYGFSAFEADGVIGDVDYTYRVLQEYFPETEFVVVEYGYFQPTAGVRNPRYTAFLKDMPSSVTDLHTAYWHYDFPSPDGRFYARITEGTTMLEIHQCGQKLIAQAQKKNWHVLPKGWAYDNSGFYFLLRPKVGYFTAGEVPISILKLNLPPKVLANAPPYEGEGFCE